MRLVHLTDPHLSHLDGVTFSSLRGKRWSGFVSWRNKRRKQYLPAVLEQLVLAVKAENADQVLLTGDLVQIGLQKEITQAAAWLKTLGSTDQVMLVPGNHDIYAHDSADEALRAWAGYLFRDECAEWPVERRLGKLSLIGLSSACVTPVFMAGGKLGDEQLEKLAGLLEHAADDRQLVCLLIHHPPLPAMTNWRKALADAPALQAVLERFPPMLIFHGHLHHNREQHWNGSRIYCTAAASSIGEASYRVIDIKDLPKGWSLCMTLKTVTVGEDGKLVFSTADQQSWQIENAP